jgi:hypothetical protein
MNTPLMRWGGDADMPAHLVPMSLAENMIQPVSFSPTIQPATTF